MSDDYELKKYEELYSLSKLELEKAHARFLSAEEKATKHFTVQAVFLGFVSIGLSEYVSVAKMPTDCWTSIFLSLYSMLALNVIASIIFHMRAVAFSWYKNVVFNDEMISHFRNHKYVDIIFSLSKRNAEDLDILNKTIQEKIRRATVAFRLTHFSIVLAVLTIASYVIVKLK